MLLQINLQIIIKIENNEGAGMCQAFITNIAFPKSLEEVAYYLFQVGCFDVEQILVEKETEWTVPKECSINDTVYFMFSKTSIDTIKFLKKQLKNISENDEFYEIKVPLMAALHRGELLYREFGGSIFAVGIVSGDVIEDSFAEDNNLHWRSRYYAPINNIVCLKRPIHIKDFRDFIFVSRTGAITKLSKAQEEKLKVKIKQ